MPVAPSIQNYAIPRGTFSFTPQGGGATILGNVRDCVYTPDITKKDHFSTQVGIRTKDLSVVSQLGANMRMTLDELTDFNLALYLLGDLGTSGTIGALTNTTIVGTLTMTGTNTVGPKLNFTGDVSLIPAGDLTLVQDGDDWLGIPVSAEVLASGGAYGHWTIVDQPTA